MGKNTIARLFLCLSVLVVGLSHKVAAQTSPAATPTPSLEKQFFKNILSDQKAIWLAPTTIRKSDTKWTIPFTVGSLALIATDRTTGDAIAKWDHLERGSSIVSTPGSIYAVAAVASSFYIAGRKRDDYRARETGILVAEASIDSLIVASGLKGISQRGRPHVGRERSEFFEGGNSFPSGHSTQAWAVATVIANEYSDKRTMQIAAYAVATAVSVARFTGGKHYLSDVLVGGALGYGIGKYVFTAHHRKSLNPNDAVDAAISRWPLIEPRYDHHDHQYGIALTWSF